MLAEVARRLGAIYATPQTGLTKKDAMVRIAEAFAADMGARPVRVAKSPAKKPARSAAKRKKR